MTTEADLITWEQLDHLRNLMMELHTAGRLEEATAVMVAARSLEGAWVRQEFGNIDADLENDPDFVRDMEEGERDLAEGHWSSHEDVMARLLASDGG